MDFALVMFIALLITGLIIILDRIFWRPGRKDRDAKEPILVEYSRAFFPVILIVFLLRSFVVEPFRIPSGSMLPSLFIGDFILVNKYKYGIRLPVINKKILQMGSPNRGDIMVFRYPHDTSVNYIKRVIGLPGDHILYKDKQVFVNGQPIAQSDASQYTLKETGARFIDAKRFTETIGDVEHDILLDGRKVQPRMEFKVPENSYFVMGDNRDYSNDSRYWGYVSDDLIIGKAFYIWFSLDTENGGGINWDRIGTSIN